MKPEEWRQVEALLDAALELVPSERGKFLNEHSTDAPELRREVEALLACEEQADGFLAAPALAFSSDFFDDREDARIGQTIGHYRIIREIGCGGMGAVFLAERADGEFQQQVALKIVWRSFNDAELARRFRQERQILASLNHPNIARLLDGGVGTDGEPFLVMEYVAGARIDDYCETKNLSTEARLQLFLAVCQGISYAHQNLVVHRDIKPSNILVTADGVPKLLDFGIAKLLDPEHAGEHTRTELRAFTPDYAAPEQMHGGQVTTAADVYSLGVLLGDLLHGEHRSPNASRSPGGWRAGTQGQQTVAANLPTDQADGNKKAKHTRRIFANAEMANIIAMARREDPARRYAAAAQLAEDVQRYLDGLPVRAQKDSFTYRTGKFVRRNKVAVGAAALVALSLVVGLAAALWQANVARKQRDRAEQRFNDVRQLSNALLTDIAPKIERLQGSTEARQALVNQSLKYLDSLAKESADDLALQSELASAYEQVGGLQGAPAKPNLSDYSGAIASYEKAQAIRFRLLAKKPDDAARRRQLAAHYHDLADVRFWTADIAGSLRDEEAALQLYQQLVSEQPAALELRLALIETNLDMALILFEKQQFAKTYPYLRTALAALEEIRQRKPDDTEVLRLLGKAYSLLGIALSWDGKQTEGEAEMAKALAIDVPLVAHNPNDTVLRNALWSVYIRASNLYDDVNDALAESFALKAVSLASETVARDPFNIQARQNLGQSHSKLAVAYLNRNKLPAAVLHAEQALAMYAYLEQNEPNNLTYKRNLGIAYTRLGDAKYKQRDWPGALAAFEKSVASFEQHVQGNDQNITSLRDIAQSCKSIGHIHRDLAQTTAGHERDTHLQAARQNYQRALDILLRLKAQDTFAEVDGKLLEEVQAAVQLHARE